jgi:UDP-2,4-diacetamido-2,4,6-trideoxy-beta-L-altropyranose hydrolase
MTEGAAIQFRRAEPADSRQVWEWRNEPGARATSFNTEPIAYETHLEWYSRPMRDEGPLIYIASLAGTDIGYVRFDVAGDSAEISVCLDPQYRRRGLGRMVIGQSARRMLSEGVARRIVALIRADNRASLTAFLGAGFVLHGREQRLGIDAQVLHFGQSRGTSP